MKQIAQAIGMEKEYVNRCFYDILQEIESYKILIKTGEKGGLGNCIADIFIFNRKNLIEYIIDLRLDVRTIIHLQDLGELDQKTVDKAHSFF